jgi:hypothetical protein
VSGQAVERLIRDGKRAGDVILRLRNFFKASEGEKTSLSVSRIPCEAARRVLRHTSLTVRPVTDEFDLAPEQAIRMRAIKMKRRSN